MLVREKELLRNVEVIILEIYKESRRSIHFAGSVKIPFIRHEDVKAFSSEALCFHISHN
jgi:hypothetical protein